MVRHIRVFRVFENASMPADASGARLRDASVFAEASAPHKPRGAAYSLGMIDLPTGNTIAETAFLMGDPARANMLSALMSGAALTAGELAAHAGVTPQTASGHLARLRKCQLVAVERQGRHRYLRLASPEVAQAL
jgi:DNA-binding transcriptional ArsR family regulator